MNLHQLRCFMLAAEELHFGRAAQRLDMLPSALGRFIRLLEECLNTTLFVRTTRTVLLTEDGKKLLRDARKLLTYADNIDARFRKLARSKETKLTVGAIDSAAAGLLPMLLNDFRKQRPDVEVQLVEDKTIRLLPRVQSGRLDIAFVRPPKGMASTLVCRPLFHETPVVAIAASHRLANRKRVAIEDVADQPLILPDRNSRPLSHDLAIKLFEDAGCEPEILQIANEKQSIVDLVSAGMGIAIVPRWTSYMTVEGVAFLPLALERSNASRLPLAAVWIRNSRDALRDGLLDTLKKNIQRYAAQA
jgi:DNA-binding transcriptional LysR family regulator